MFIGSKTHKDVIKKAQEIAKKREMDAEEKKQKEAQILADKVAKDLEKSKPTMTKVKVGEKP